MKVLIAGGGIGGLTAALSLHALGHTDIRVVEANPAPRPAGVGLNILPNAVRELTELGLYQQLAECAISTQELRFYTRHGQLVWNERRGTAAGYHWPQLSIHRGHLSTVLARAVRERLGQDAILPGARVVSCAPRPGTPATVELDHAGTGRTERVSADVVIGADGIHSAVRASLYPGEGRPPGNGMVMWRGISWAEPFLTGKSMIVAGTDTQRIVFYPIAEAHAGTRSLVNWVAARPANPGDEHDEDWHRQATTADVFSHFGDWSFYWLDIPAILAAAHEVYVYPVIDRDPLPRWTFDNVTLLGDAAHAMYPMGSNGATQSIMDARVLARALTAERDVGAALAGYEAERRPVMTRLQASNRWHGPEAVLSIVHQRAPHGFTHLHDVISATELAEIAAAYTTTAGLDIDTVNNRPSLGACPSGKTAATGHA